MNNAAFSYNDDYSAPELTLLKITPNSITLPDTYNYIAAFLTFNCPYSCSYCINQFNSNPESSYSQISGKEWISFFNRLKTRNVPITLQGGEPGAHPDFLEIVKELTKTHSIDILTSLAFDLKKFVKEINPVALNRDAPYAPIRVSYHPEQMSLRKIIQRVGFLTNAGFRVGVYGVMHPNQIGEIKHAQAVCSDLGIDFRTKPFLGWYEGKLYGEYAYKDACASKVTKSCECAPSELLIAPDGSTYPCHHHLYNKIGSTGNTSYEKLDLHNNYAPCEHFGNCNPCDVKIKNNRFQNFGHVSVKIKF